MPFLMILVIYIVDLLIYGAYFVLKKVPDNKKTAVQK